KMKRLSQSERYRGNKHQPEASSTATTTDAGMAIPSKYCQRQGSTPSNGIRHSFSRLLSRGEAEVPPDSGQRSAERFAAVRGLRRRGRQILRLTTHAHSTRGARPARARGTHAPGRDLTGARG